MRSVILITFVVLCTVWSPALGWMRTSADAHESEYADEKRSPMFATKEIPKGKLNTHSTANKEHKLGNATTAGKEHKLDNANTAGKEHKLDTAGKEHKLDTAGKEHKLDTAGKEHKLDDATTAGKEHKLNTTSGEKHHSNEDTKFGLTSSKCTRTDEACAATPKDVENYNEKIEAAAAAMQKFVDTVACQVDKTKLNTTTLEVTVPTECYNKP